MEGLSPSDIFGLNRSRAAAKSMAFNPRNLEFPWYAFWTKALFRLATKIDIHQCTVAPQFPIWRVWTPDETELGTIVMLPEDGDEMDAESQGPSTAIDEGEDSDSDIHDEHSDGHSSDDNKTISSLTETLTTKTRSRITDFALVFWVENNTTNPHKDDEADEDFLIDKEYIAALIEIKRAPTRKLKGKALVDARKIQMFYAQEAVFRQALYMFANDRWSKQESVLVIAATGDQWTYTVISRSDQLSLIAAADETNADWEPDASEFGAMPWSEPAVWGKGGRDASSIDEVVKWMTDHFVPEEVQRKN